MYTQTLQIVNSGTIESGFKGKKILFANIPADGHFSPLTGLAVHLKKAGHDVRWYTGPSYYSRIKELGIPYYLFDKAKEITIRNIDEVFPQRKHIHNPIRKVIFDIRTYFIERGPEFFDDIKEINKTFDFDVLICDSAFTGLAFVKEKMKKHVVAVGVFPLGESSKKLAPPIFGLTPAKSLSGRGFHALLRFLTNRVLFRKPHAILDEQYRREGFSRNGKNIIDMPIDKSTIFLQSGTPGFEYHRDKISSHIHFIGPLLPFRRKAGQCLSFEEKLYRYEKILLVTQGTFEGDVNKLIVPTLEAFKGTKYLVVATTAGWNTSMLQARYKGYDNIVIEDFIPFDLIMPHADVYISNGGYGGVMLAISHKLPMVAGGLHEGKNEICARIGFFKLGVNLRTEKPRSEKIKKAVMEVLQDPDYRYNVEQLSEEFKRYNPAVLCGQLIDALPDLKLYQNN
ncbi:MAG TPA: nucleotide disphospho-sugar-binding domain-containing protein [Flavihumibacter sp.]